MSRIYVQGWYYDQNAPARFTKGWAEIEAGGRLIETRKDFQVLPQGRIIKGIAMPALANAHTHLADFLLKTMVKPGMTVEELVAPPNGLKHRMLPRIDIEVSIQKALNIMRATGTGHFCDFREGGLGGVEDMGRALVSKGGGLKGTILGRPKGLRFEPEEVDRILSMCDGIGLSGIGDWDQGEISELARHVKRTGKVLALHASEAVRENVDAILDLDPDFVVHMTMGQKGDFHRLSTLGIPVVACPRSNMYYGRKPPLRAMLDADVQVCLGTDNAMMSDMSMFNELKAVRELGLAPSETWNLVESSWKLLNQDYGMPKGVKGMKWMAVETRTDKPLVHLTDTGPNIKVIRI